MSGKKPAAPPGPGVALAKKIDESLRRLTEQQRSEIAAAAGLADDASNVESSARRGMLTLFACCVAHARLDGKSPPGAAESARARRRLGVRRSKSQDAADVPLLSDCLGSGSVVEVLAAAWGHGSPLESLPLFTAGAAVLRKVAWSGTWEMAVASVASAAAGAVKTPDGGAFLGQSAAEAGEAELSTTPAGACLLAGLAIRPDDVPDDLSQMRIIDPVCGYGTLLAAAAERVKTLRKTDGRQRPDDDTAFAETVVHGLDSDPSACHIAAAALGASGRNIIPAPIRPGPPAAAGTLELLDDKNAGGDLRRFGRQTFDLVLMNPPRASAGTRLSQWAGKDRASIAAREKQLATGDSIATTSSAATLFLSVGEKLTADNGTLAFVCHASTATGAAREGLRRALGEKFHIEWMVVSHDPENPGFAVPHGKPAHPGLLVVARRTSAPVSDRPPTKIVKLAVNPSTPSDAATLAAAINAGTAAPSQARVEHCAAERIAAGDWAPILFWGEQISAAGGRLRHGDKSVLPGGAVRLGDVCDLGPCGEADFRGGVFHSSDSFYADAKHRALHGSKPKVATTMRPEPSALSVVPGKEAAAERLWSQRSRLLILRYIFPQHSVWAARLDDPALGYLWAPITIKTGAFRGTTHSDVEKSLCVWLNSSLGRSGLHSASVALASDKLRRIAPSETLNIPVPAMSASQVDSLAGAFDQVADMQPSAGQGCPVRQALDGAVVEHLGVDPSLMKRIREEWATEPWATGQRAVPDADTDRWAGMARFPNDPTAGADAGSQTTDEDENRETTAVGTTHGGGASVDGHMAAPEAGPAQLAVPDQPAPAYSPSPPRRRRLHPMFATNDPQTGETVAAVVNEALTRVHEGIDGGYRVSAATAFFNVGGWAQIAETLKQAPSVRLLIGAQPDPESEHSSRRPQSQGESRRAMQNLEAWMATERDRLGFTREDDDLIDDLVAWLRSADGQGAPRVDVRRPVGRFLHGKAFLVDHSLGCATLVGSANLTYAGLTRNRELVLGTPESETSEQVLEWFDRIWEDAPPFDLAGLFEQRRAGHDPELVFARMLQEAAKSALSTSSAGGDLTGLDVLTAWQTNGAKTAARMLEQHHGALICDDVGLGKTFTAAKVIAGYTRSKEPGDKYALVLCPAAVVKTWSDVLHNKLDMGKFIVKSYEKFRREAAAEMDSKPGEGSGIDVYSRYALVVLDEAHRLRNRNLTRETVDWVIAGGGSPKDALLLTATPVNNGLPDLESLIGLGVRDDDAFAGAGIPSLRSYFREAYLKHKEREPRSEDLFDLVRQVTVRYTRRFVDKNYAGESMNGGEAVKFPDRGRIGRIDAQPGHADRDVLKAVGAALVGHGAERPDSDDDYKQSGMLIFAPYRRGRYRTPEAKAKLSRDDSGARHDAFQRTLLLKRLDSSPHALLPTVTKLIDDRYRPFMEGLQAGRVLALDDLPDDDDDSAAAGLGEFAGKGEPASDYWIAELQEACAHDLKVLEDVKIKAEAAARADTKPEALAGYLRQVAASNPGGGGSLRRKVLVFTEYADTAEHLNERIRELADEAPDGDPLALYKNRIPEHPVTGGTRDSKESAAAIASFDPGDPGTDRFDLLISTDALAEGVNLQAAGRCVNYDLPWNPMRLVQRYGRVDRLRSPHDKVDLQCFFPGPQLDEWLGLIEKLRAKLDAANAAVGVDETLPVEHSASGGLDYNTAEVVRSMSEGDPRHINAEIEHAISQQELDHRLAQLRDKHGAAEIDGLPYTAGSGFAGPAGAGNRLVFCAEIGEGGPVAFRTVRCGPGWELLTTPDPAAGNALPVAGAGQVAMDDGIAEAITAADPAGAQRHMPPEAHDAAYTAWTHTRADIHRRHKNARPAQTPAPFRRATRWLETTPGSANVRARLKAAPFQRQAENEIAELLRQGAAGVSLLHKTEAILDRHGIKEPANAAGPEPGDIRPEDVRLVCWMAVAG